MPRQRLRPLLGICLTLIALIAAGRSSGKRRDSSEAFAVHRGYWSGQAVSLFNTVRGIDPVSNRELSLYSPDHKKVVRVHNQKVAVVVEGKEFSTDFWKKTAAELGWAPDSSRFFLTWTQGGNMGDWHVAVYNVSAAGVREVKGIEKKSVADFEKYIRSLPPQPKLERVWWDNAHYCYSNAVAAQWLNGSSELLLSVMVEPEGDCRYSEEFLVYRVAVPSGNILQRYGEQEAHRLFDADNLPLIAP